MHTWLALLFHVVESMVSVVLSPRSSGVLIVELPRLKSLVAHCRLSSSANDQATNLYSCVARSGLRLEIVFEISNARDLHSFVLMSFYCFLPHTATISTDECFCNSAIHIHPHCCTCRPQSPHRPRNVSQSSHLRPQIRTPAVRCISA